MKYAPLPDTVVPGFCWDRKLTTQAIKEQLVQLSGIKRILFVAWILREASMSEVWTFFTPGEIRDNLESVSPF